jgi:hypothetical protein
MSSLFDRLSADPFRRKFRLVGKERAYVEMWGMDRVAKHAREIILQRLAAAEPKNDGRQTPWRNHPVFVAQHATGTCCRGCLAKWHGIPKGRELSSDEVSKVVDVIVEWVTRQFP